MLHSKILLTLNYYAPPLGRGH